MRRYGCWAGKPNGTREDPARCAVEVAEPGRAIHFYQCLRKRGKGPGGLYCAQHAKMVEKYGAKSYAVHVPEDRP